MIVGIIGKGIRGAKDSKSVYSSSRLDFLNTPIPRFSTAKSRHHTERKKTFADLNRLMRLPALKAL